MHAWAERASQIRDSKAETFIRWLKAIVRPDGKWSDERVIIFTEYRATQNWLNTLLAAEGLTEGDRLMTMYGGMDDELRDRIKAAFQTSPRRQPCAHLTGDGRGLRRHRPAKLLPPPGAFRNPLEPEPHGTAQWAHRPARTEI